MARRPAVLDGRGDRHPRRDGGGVRDLGGARHHRARRHRAGGRVHRARPHRAVDAAEQRVRRVLGALHGRRVRADRAPAHAPLRHEARGAGRGRRDDPHARREEPGGRLLPAGQDGDARRRARLAHGGRPVPPARLRDHLRGRRRARAHHRRARARPRRDADLPARRRQRPAGHVVRRAAGLGPLRRGGRARREARLRAVRPRAGGRGRGRALRPVLVRDHPPARGDGLLQAGRGRRLRPRRPHLRRRRAAGRDERRAALVQPRGPRAAAPEADRGRAPAAGRAAARS